MNGTILEVINGGSIYLLLVDSGEQVIEHVVDHRSMMHIIEGEGLDDPHDLRGLAVDVTDGGIVFTDEADGQ